VACGNLCGVRGGGKNFSPPHYFGSIGRSIDRRSIVLTKFHAFVARLVRRPEPMGIVQSASADCKRGIRREVIKL
jgi:hypothetical protein